MAQCAVGTVRYYEKEGLLPAPARTAANYRSYGSAHIDQLRFIRNCRVLNITHEEIRALLGFMDQPAGDCGAVNQLLDEHIAHVQVRLRELQDLRRQLTGLRAQCQAEQAVDACGIVQGLASMETAEKPPHATHL